MTDPHISLSTRVKPSAQTASSRRTVANLEKWFRNTLIVILALALPAAIYGWYHWGPPLFGPPSEARTSPPVQTAAGAEHQCDNIYRSVHLTSQPKPMLKIGGCAAGWNIQQGGLVLIDRNGNEYGPFYKGDSVGHTPPAIEWRAAGTSAIVKVRFY